MTTPAQTAATPKREHPSSVLSYEAHLLSPSIISDPKNTALYTNRAIARLRLGLYDSVISDCQTCLSLAPDNMKAHYYLAQAQLEQRDPSGAVDNALLAHALCAKTNDKSLAAVTNLVLKAKQARWEERERRRIRESKALERSVLELLAEERRQDLTMVDDAADVREVEEQSDAKTALLQDIFERARAESEKRREVPEWAIDDISFGIMVDPTKTGKSYERASIVEHLRRSATDPLTREPLLASELRPNLGLKQACEEFLEHNGWAVDW
ncbi:hypothetical protein G7046_g6102 [Stylonectria norvegica]|nr:hypothetical protein G7046_g6102 [Stylonectria norvegica]